MPCNCCQITDNTFGEDDARQGLKSYHRRGPAAQTREILKAVRSFGLKDATLLDIGGGIGAIHHELLDGTARKATHVDASAAYLRAAEAEAARRGHADRVTFLHADFTDVASEIPPADIVTLDRVVCCYPDFHSLLTAAASRSRRLLALTYPRETWYMRIGLRADEFHPAPAPRPVPRVPASRHGNGCAPQECWHAAALCQALVRLGSRPLHPRRLTFDL